MKKYLLPRNGKFYKANMHAHTTVSDGGLSPEEMKRAFMEQGYSIVAYTDHEVMIPHPELTGEDFLAITSYEVGVGQGEWTPFAKCYHLNVYSPEENRTTSASFCERSVWGNAKNYVTDEMRAVSHDRYYTIDEVNKLIERANSEGCLVSYNHPGWSLQTREDYIDLKGVWGVEWHNTGCVEAGFVENETVFSEMLVRGLCRPYPLATDDCHGHRDMFGGWICVKARALDYASVFGALRRGEFYSSTGPSIKALYIEDGKLTVRCSAAARVSVISDVRWTASKRRDGKPITEATFDLAKLIEISSTRPDLNTHHFRVEVVDKYGKRALTRGYFLDELKLI
jgi:hypothetical protein